MSADVDDDPAISHRCRPCGGVTQHTRTRRCAGHSVYRCDRCNRGHSKCDNYDFEAPTFTGSTFPTNYRRIINKHQTECAFNAAADLLMNDVDVAGNDVHAMHFEPGGDSDQPKDLHKDPHDVNLDNMMQDAGDFEHVTDSNEALSVINNSLTSSQLTLDAQAVPYQLTLIHIS